MELESNSVLYKKPKLWISLAKNRPKPGTKLNYESRFGLQKPNAYLPPNSPKILSKYLTQHKIWSGLIIFCLFFLLQTLIDKYWTKKYLFLSYNSWKAIDIFPVTNWDYWIVLAPILKPDFCGGTQKIFQMKMNDESPTNYTAL